MIRILPGLLALCLGMIPPASAAGGADSASASRRSAKEVLDHFVGSWKGEVETEAPDGKKTRQTWRNTFSWTLDGSFLRDEGGEASGASPFVGMWKYDESQRRYRSWYFLSQGAQVAELAYDWDAKGRTLKGTADLGGGMSLETVDRFIDKDRYDWSMTIKDREGRLLQRLTARQTRIR